MRISLIAAMAENGTIGLDGGLPWHMPADLQYFKRVTMGCPVIMGRKTYESIGRGLPGRSNIVVTRNLGFHTSGADVVHDLHSAYDKASLVAEKEGRSEIFVIGGAEIYSQALSAANRLYLTLIHAEITGDSFFPHFDKSGWVEIKRELHPSKNKGQPRFSFTILERTR